MDRIVLDASALVEFLRWSSVGQIAADELPRDGVSARIPHLAAVEVISAFRSLVARADVASERAASAIDDLADLPVTPASGRAATVPDLGAARRSHCLRRDMYGTCRGTGRPLLISDRRLANASGPDAAVAVIG